jgi:hypothetical protein
MRRYQNISELQNSPFRPEKRYLATTKYPEIPLSVSDIYVITQQNDRYDLLANQYYNDSTLWWIISIANADTLIQNSLVPPVGVQIRIPSDISNILNSYNKLNQNG